MRRPPWHRLALAAAGLAGLALACATDDRATPAPRPAEGAPTPLRGRDEAPLRRGDVAFLRGPGHAPIPLRFPGATLEALPGASAGEGLVVVGPAGRAWLREGGGGLTISAEGKLPAIALPPDVTLAESAPFGAALVNAEGAPLALVQALADGAPAPVHGGSGGLTVDLSGARRLEIKLSTWGFFRVPVGPPVRFARGYDPDAARFVLFGGDAVDGTPSPFTVIARGGRYQYLPLGGPPLRRDGAMVWDPVRKALVLVGGATTADPLADTWTFQGLRWRPLAATAPKPSRGPTATYDPSVGRVVAYTVADDGSAGLYQLLPDGSAWIEDRRGGLPTTPRRSGALFYDRAAGELRHHGGLSLSPLGLIRETWAFGANARVVATNGPLAGWNAQALWDEGAGATLLHPGTSMYLVSVDGTQADQTDPGALYRLTGATWSAPLVTAPGGLAAYEGVAASTTARVLTVGAGMAVTGPATTGAEYMLLPTFAFEGACVYDSVYDAPVRFGGQLPYSGQPPFGAATGGDEARWSGGHWIRVGAPLGAVYGLAAARDPVRKQTWVYGGRRDGIFPGTLHRRADGGAWTALGSPLPKPRERATMVWDPDGDRALLFGGWDASLTRYGDLWSIRGADGVVTPLAAVGPSARQSASAIWDAKSHRMILFGGAGPGSVYGDTWAFDGAAWTKLAVTGPSARAKAVFAYYAQEGVGVLHGGEDVDGNLLGDTWLWSEDHWEPLGLVPGPGLRAASLACEDPSRAELFFTSGNIGGAGEFVDGLTFVSWKVGGACRIDGDCAHGSCVDGVCCESPRCGACETCAGSVPGRCEPVQGASDPDTCRGDRTCDAVGACRGKLAAACASDRDCASGFCTDGVCCDRRCDGACEACAAAGKESAAESGICGAARLEGDPTCGTRRAACVDDERLVREDRSVVSCAPFRCAADACLKSCRSIDDCARGFACDSAGFCVAVRLDGGAGCAVGGGGELAAPALLLGLVAAVRRRRRGR